MDINPQAQTWTQTSTKGFSRIIAYDDMFFAIDELEGPFQASNNDGVFVALSKKNLPSNLEFHDITAFRNNHNQFVIVLATNQGVFVCFDRTEWRKFSNGLPSYPVTCIALYQQPSFSDPSFTLIAGVKRNPSDTTSSSLYTATYQPSQDSMFWAPCGFPTSDHSYPIKVVLNRIAVVHTSNGSVYHSDNLSNWIHKQPSSEPVKAIGNQGAFVFAATASSIFKTNVNYNIEWHPLNSADLPGKPVSLSNTLHQPPNTPSILLACFEGKGIHFITNWGSEHQWWESVNQGWPESNGLFNDAIAVTFGFQSGSHAAFVASTNQATLCIVP